MPKLKQTIGEEKIKISDKVFGLDDYSYYGTLSPSLFLFMSVDPDQSDGAEIPRLHSARMAVNEKALVEGVKTMTSLAIKFGITG